VPPRSMLVQSVNLTSGSEGGSTSGDSAAATPSASASPDELQGSIVLLVFQLAQPGATSATPATPATPAGEGAQVR
jgi:hypothetical protein